MASSDADFAAYVAARWPGLVRTVVLAGCPRGQADDVTLTGLARCRSGWDRVHRSGDVEVHVHREVLHVWHHRRRRDPPTAEPHPSDLVAELAPRLDALTTEQREALVLRAVAGLETDQVADVLDLAEETVRKVVPGAPGVEVVRAAAASIAVLPAANDDVASRARGQQRRRRRALLAAALGGAVLLGLATWAGAALSREGVRERPADVVRVLNPTAISWYADGRLHLREVTVQIPGITDLVTVGERVVYLDEDGIVGQVAGDGKVHEVGVAVPGSRLLGWTDRSWAVWVEPGDPDLRLVVWDLAARAEVGSLRSGSPLEPIAIDQGHVAYTTGSGGWTWEPPDGEPAQLPPIELLDQASSTRVFQRDEQIEIVQPLFGLSFLRAGAGAQLSFGGRYVLSRVPGPWEPGEPYDPLLYDTRSGEAVETGVGPGEQVVAAAFTPLQEVAWLVDSGDALLSLRTCEPGTGVCQDVAPVPGDGSALFAEP